MKRRSVLSVGVASVTLGCLGTDDDCLEGSEVGAAYAVLRYEDDPDEAEIMGDDQKERVYENDVLRAGIVRLNDGEGTERESRQSGEIREVQLSGGYSTQELNEAYCHLQDIRSDDGRYLSHDEGVIGFRWDILD